MTTWVSLPSCWRAAGDVPLLPLARLFGWQTLSRRELTPQEVRGLGHKVVCADLYAVTMSLETSVAKQQDKVTPDPLCPRCQRMWKMAIHTPDKCSM